MMPTVTKNLIIINVLFYLGTIVAQSYGIDLANYLGLHFFMAEDFNPAQLITYMFMHGGFTHLFFNMFAVWMFGRILEQVWGPKRFLFYYTFFILSILFSTFFKIFFCFIFLQNKKLVMCIFLHLVVINLLILSLIF